ncbi:unnamed protein product [Allacma fusca]|uniref:MULE transposase domain-containing protein n=1 Tax=Allacma fusca TaxID=39272 RepID=A0A8J2P9F4_9HEXA|nr:unnamed protein product [Allacma fusca]
MLIFATADSLDKLAYCETWLVDGTFKSCPPQFSQIYSIQGIYRNSYSVPLVYAYLPGKDYECYLEFFGVVRRNVPGEPASIISDFELAAINACKETFIATELNGCLFHMTQKKFLSMCRKMLMFTEDTNCLIMKALKFVQQLDRLEHLPLSDSLKYTMRLSRSEESFQ